MLILRSFPLSFALTGTRLENPGSYRVQTRACRSYRLALRGRLDGRACPRHGRMPHVSASESARHHLFTTRIEGMQVSWTPLTTLHVCGVALLAALAQESLSQDPLF